MQNKKVFISFILLLIYSFGFAHNLIPHNEDVDENGQVTHIHEHHVHTEGEAEHDHLHIQHQNHIDEGIFDLIVCFLSEVKHPASDCTETHLLSNELDVSASQNFYSVKLTSMVLTFLSQPSELVNSTFTSVNDDEVYDFIPLERSPHRGPPTFSC